MKYCSAPCGKADNWSVQKWLMFAFIAPSGPIKPIKKKNLHFFIGQTYLFGTKSKLQHIRERLYNFLQSFFKFAWNVGDLLNSHHWFRKATVCTLFREFNLLMAYLYLSSVWIVFFLLNCIFYHLKDRCSYKHERDQQSLSCRLHHPLHAAPTRQHDQPGHWEGIWEIMENAHRLC